MIVSKDSLCSSLNPCVLVLAVFLQAPYVHAIDIGVNIGDVEEILTQLVVSRSEVSTQMTPVAIAGNFIYTANIEHGPGGDIDGVGLHTVLRKGTQQQNGSFAWESTLIEDRTVFDEWHTAPSIGIDSGGHLHIAYNMHNIPWQYKRMTAPHDLSSFAFFGQAVTLAEIERWKFDNQTTFPGLGTASIPGTQITYPHFFKDAAGQLLVTYRFANKPKRSWPERTLGIGIASYDVATQDWQPIGFPLTVTSDDFDYDPLGPLQPVPFAAEQGWTGYAPRLMFGPQNEMHVLMFWREGTPGGILTRPCHFYSIDRSTFYTLDNTLESLPITPDRCGNTGFANTQGFYSLLDTAMDSMGNPFHVVSPVGASRKLVSYEQSSQLWVSEDSPSGATEIFFDSADNLWAIASGPRIYRRVAGQSSWETMFENTAAGNCYPKATLSDDHNTAVIHMQSCDQLTVTLYGLRIGVNSTPQFCNNLLVTVDISNSETATSGNDVILGTSGADVISAQGGSDVVCGLGGDDIIYAGSGDDWIDAGTGDDEVFAGSGDDTVLGGQGADSLYGGPGDDLITASLGNDVIYGNSGSDTLNGGDGVDEIRGGSGDDVITTGSGATVGSGVIVDAGSGDDMVTGGPDADEIRGSTDQDIIAGGGGDDRLFGGGGEDTIDGQGGDDFIRGNAANDSLSGGEGNDDVNGGASKDLILGGPGSDVLTGSTGNDDLRGEAGDDTVRGGGGNDVLYGDAGVDLLMGGGGNDLLDGGEGGPDQCDGEAGVDTADASCEILVSIP